MEHRRRISPEFLEDLKDGILKPVTEMVKQDSELFLGFRTMPNARKKSGRDEIVGIYYRGHIIFEIKKLESPKGSYRCAFDFNHARFTADYPRVLRDLQKLGMQLPKSKGQSEPRRDVKEPTRSRVNLLSWTIGTDQAAFDFPWETVKNTFKSLMDDYMDPNAPCDSDYFAQKRDDHREKNLYIEKQHEQRLVLRNQTMDRDDCFLVYDMEYTEPKISGLWDEISRFDLLAFHVKRGCAVEWYILEVKSTKAALGGDSGMWKHFGDMSAYAESDLATVRIDDAKGIFADYQTLFGTDCPTFCGEIQPLYGFVMTGEVEEDAKKYYDQLKGACSFFTPNAVGKDNFVLCVNESLKKETTTP